jgi:hypothetical protein
LHNTVTWYVCSVLTSRQHKNPHCLFWKLYDSQKQVYWA